MTVTNKKFSVDQLLPWAIFLSAFWYLSLCLANYLTQRPLWNDEQCVFNNIKALDIKQMFGQPLSNDQVFPRAYLFVIQRFSQIFDFHLLALRLPSFLCMIAAFFVWLKISAREFKNRLEYLTFVLSWSASAVLIYYAAELKQYSMDVLTAALFIWFLYNEAYIRLRNQKEHRLILIALPLLGLFSYPAFLFCFIILYNLILSAWHERSARTDLVNYVIALVVCLTVSYFFDMRFRHLETVTKGFGDYFVYFSSAGEFLKTFGEGTMNLFSRWFVERPKILKQIGIGFVSLGMVYMCYAFFASIRREKFYLKSLSVLAFALYMGLFILGCLHKYMFTCRARPCFFVPSSCG